MLIFLFHLKIPKNYQSDIISEVKWGKQLADKMCFQLGEIFKNIKCKAKNSTEYVLVHTPMPAVLIKLPGQVLKNSQPASIALYNSLLNFSWTNALHV